MRPDQASAESPGCESIEELFAALESPLLGYALRFTGTRAQAEGRTVGIVCPDASLLDLHLALHLGRRVNADQQIDFLGRSWPISDTARKTVAIIHHPQRQFWVVSQPPKPPQTRWPDILGKFSL